MGTISYGDEASEFGAEESQQILIACRSQVLALACTETEARKRSAPAPDGSSVSSLWKQAIRPATASASDGEPARMFM
jgi:hypothetical protein